MREAVYQRARAALARQLTAVDPPLSTREIETQHRELEDAVARLEADYAPQEEAELADSPEVPPARGNAPTAVLKERARPAVAPAEETEEAAAADEEEADGEEEDEEEFEDEERGSRTPLLIALVALVLVIGGAGAFAYAERGAIMSFLGMGGPSAAPADQTAATGQGIAEPGSQQAAGAASDAGPDKRQERLNNGTDAPPAHDEIPTGQMAATEPASPADTAPTEPPPSPALPAQQDAPAGALPSEQSTGLQPDQQTAALQQPGQSIVAQRAIFYFKGANGAQAQQIEGSVSWAQVTRESGPAVQATLHLTDKDVTTTVTIYKNNDSNLPASHLVEVQFSGDLGSSPIQKVPALVLKPTEQARGQPLAGAAVPVTGDLFWIALSDDKEQVTKNIQLLRDGSWFDLPILFNDGAQGLLTFEKGIPGDKLFETVMAAWTPT